MDIRPSVFVRLSSVSEQIEEIKKMVWRNELEARIEKETKAGTHVQAETEYNNKQLLDKLGVLLKVQKELQDEAGSDTPVEGSTL